jgi:hypothetical protein
MNVLADHHTDALHHQPPSLIGLFPTWLPGTRAALFHGERPITSDLPTYVRLAAHTPPMKTYLIHCSQTATNRDSPWTDDTFDDIAWQPLGDALRHLPTGQRTQLSKYMNDMLPTLR